MKHTINQGIARLSTIEAEIKQLKKKTALGIMEIGDKLLEAKKLVPYGEWEKWLSCNVDISLRTARNFMNIALTFATSDRQALADLEITKLYYLAGLSEDKRNALLLSQNIRTMSTRVLKKQIEKIEKQENLLEPIFTDEMREITKCILESDDIDLIQYWKQEVLVPLLNGISEIIMDLEVIIGEQLQVWKMEKSTG